MPQTPMPADALDPLRADAPPLLAIDGMKIVFTSSDEADIEAVRRVDLTLDRRYYPRGVTAVLWLTES